MADYRLPMDADGVKYHGTVDQNEENPGHFMYGLDENGNKRIIRTDENGNVLTRLTGSSVEDGLSVKQVNKLEVIVRLNNVEVGAGQSVMGYSDTVAERLDFTEFRYNLAWSDRINWRLRCIPRITNSPALAGSEIKIDEAGSQSSGILVDRVDFTRYSFILHNDSAKDVTLEQIEILGVRA